MKLKNLLFFASPFVISALVTYLFSIHNIMAVLSYFVFLSSVTGAFMFIIFLKYYAVSKRYTQDVINRYAEYKIAAVIPTYNEDHKLVQDTAFSVQLACKRRGDVYILDDSRDDEIRKGIDELKKSGLRVVRRESRRGYKAGAINDFIKSHGDKYDLLAIFDADQRPISCFFDEVLKFFEDPCIAFVQVPQAYTELETGIAHSSYWQQEPFLRIVMRGRESSIFSLGSGTVFRIKSLQDVGGLDENNVTEDIATSIDLHSRGYKSVYVDKPLIWYGAPPKDLKAYLSQQSRWSLGSFQFLPKLLKSNLSLKQFRDYLNSWMYWIKEGPLTIFEIIAPIVFLLFNTPFIRVDPVLYLAAYVPYFFSVIVVFVYAGKEYYGLRGCQMLRWLN
jgi:cellulose synthase (UDP-forming)